MTIPHRETTPTSVEGIWMQVTDDGSRTLVHQSSGDGSQSGCGAIAETRHVYLQNSGVADRLHNGIATSVLEIGLGTGMGLLVTVDAAAIAKTSLRYESWECNWLPADVLRELKLGDCLHDRKLAERFINFREAMPDPAINGCYRWECLPSISTTLDISVQVGDVRQHRFDEKVKFDAIYFDPFDPNVNPDLWEPFFLERIQRLLTDDGRLVTYCCSRKVRDAMAAAGFKVHRVPGPTGGKREVLVATR